jgi:predicted RNase H-like HicB family nuclease
MCKRDIWEIHEVVIKKDERCLKWIASDNYDYEVGNTPQEALEALYEVRKEYVEKEY